MKGIKDDIKQLTREEAQLEVSRGSRNKKWLLGPKWWWIMVKRLQNFVNVYMEGIK